MNNRFGLDVAYYRKELKALSDSLVDRTPEELNRYLLTMAGKKPSTKEEATVTVPPYVKSGYAKLIADFAEDLPEQPNVAKVLKQARFTLCTIFQGHKESMSLHGYHNRVCDFLHDLEMEHKNSEEKEKEEPVPVYNLEGWAKIQKALAEDKNLSHAILFPEKEPWRNAELNAMARAIVGETIQPGSKDFFVDLVYKILKEVQNKFTH
jgi:hypothetical protein